MKDHVFLFLIFNRNIIRADDHRVITNCVLVTPILFQWRGLFYSCIVQLFLINRKWMNFKLVICRKKSIARIILISMVNIEAVEFFLSKVKRVSLTQGQESRWFQGHLEWNRELEINALHESEESYVIWQNSWALHEKKNVNI